MENAFKGIDKNRDGVIDRSELLHALHAQGQRHLTEKDITDLMTGLDINKDGQIQFSEYAHFVKKVHNNKEHNVLSSTDKKGANVFKVSNSSSYSSFSEEERTAYVKVINSTLKDDEDCKKYLPIDPNNMEVFTLMKDGIILCKLINAAVKGTIDERTINKKQNMNIYLMTVNFFNFFLIFYFLILRKIST
jgi:hypothetical protein